MMGLLQLLWDFCTFGLAKKWTLGCQEWGALPDNVHTPVTSQEGTWVTAFSRHRPSPRTHQEWGSTNLGGVSLPLSWVLWVGGEHNPDTVHVPPDVFQKGDMVIPTLDWGPGMWVMASPRHGPSPHTHQRWGSTNFDEASLPLARPKSGCWDKAAQLWGARTPSQWCHHPGASLEVSPDGCSVGFMRRSRRCTRTLRPRWTTPCWPSASSSVSTPTGPMSSTVMRPPRTARVWGGCMALCPPCHLGRARRLLGLGGEAVEQVVEQENGWRNRRMGDGEEEWVMEQKNGWWNRRMGGRAEEWVNSRRTGGLSAC